MKLWRESEEEPRTSCEYIINGHVVKNIRMEQAYKGNFYLLALIDGKERKFVLGKNKDDYSFIESTGIVNLSPEQLKSMVEKYFNL